MQGGEAEPNAARAPMCLPHAPWEDKVSTGTNELTVAERDRQQGPRATAVTQPTTRKEGAPSLGKDFLPVSSVGNSPHSLSFVVITIWPKHPQARWYGLNYGLSKSVCEVLTPSSPERGLIWRQGL